MAEPSAENSDRSYAYHVKQAEDLVENSEIPEAAQVHALLAVAAALRGLDVTQMISGGLNTYGRQ